MAVAREQFPLPHSAWFDANNPGPLHDALRADYARTVEAAGRRPSLRRHMESCDVCRAIGGATATAPNPITSRKRVKLAIDNASMRRLLDLPDNYEIVHMYAEHDPNVVFVLLAGEGLPDVDPARETPLTGPETVTRHTAPGAS